ncbi:MAG: cytochrome c, partial [Candidatus Omnitrophica bacterium]|nr:cytochrome c [Candidatus Omnitrophota bacterium]
MKNPVPFLVLGLLMVLIPVAASAGETVEFPQGVRLEIRSADGRVDIHHTRLVTLSVSEGEDPTPFLPAGPFSATWTGHINVDLRDRFRFGFQGNGTFQFFIDGRVRLEADSRDPESLVGRRARLGKGPNAFVATYQSPATGVAECRLMWESTEFPMETVPATVLTRFLEPSIVWGLMYREGRELFAEYRCLKCHQPEKDFEEVGRPMLELLEDAPSFETIASRTRDEWIPFWLESPQRLYPDSPMPRILHGPDAAQNAVDIAAYFESLNAESQSEIEGEADEGKSLFDQLGCIGCHTLTAEERENDSFDRIPLDHIPAKWKSSGELSEFLQDPQSHFESIRMPNFKLTIEEANDLATFLMDRKKEPLDPIQGNPMRGEDLVGALRCLNCHGEEKDADASAPSFETIRSKEGVGCLSIEATEDRRAPLFPLTQDEIGAIQSFLKSGETESLNQSDPVETSERYIRKLRCNACHERDGHFDVWTLLNPPEEPEEDFEGDLSDPEVDQSRPSLTFVGEKLRPDWLAKRLKGEVG